MRPNSFRLTQQPREECMVGEPIKETPKCMNDVVKNVQEEPVEFNLSKGEIERMV